MFKFHFSISQIHFQIPLRLLYFNPENDLALAANDPHYTPPASALQMATDLQHLPLRWAEPGDLILLRKGPLPTPPIREGSGLREEIFLKVQGHSPFRGSGERVSPLPDGRGRGWVCLPWGWSPLAITDLRRAGVPASLLPTYDQMQAFRALAGRATAATVLSHLREQLNEAGFGDMIVGEAHVCHSLDEARYWHARFGESMFKQPWSGSGRGLLPAHDGILTPKNEDWIQRTLRLQGYVMAEPRYDKSLDFALEFWRHADGTVTYEGLSIFTTSAGGVYTGNIVDNEERKLKSLKDAAPCLAAELHCGSGLSLSSLLTTTLADELAALPPTFYNGPIGIDMLVTNDRRVHPCVEINFRMTMGWVALKLKHDLTPDETGVFSIIQQGGHYQVLLSKDVKQE